MKNSFLLTNEINAVKAGRAVGSTEFIVATDYPEIFSKDKDVTAYKTVKKSGDAQNCKFLYLADLTNDAIVDEVINATYDGAKLIVSANYSLDEIGAIYARYKLSPVQVLHKYGLLDHCAVVGGVHLDRDDIDLMAQSGTPLILCPTASAGYGYGSPRYQAYRNKLVISLGSGDNRYNSSGNMIVEAQTLLLLVNCDMRSNSVVSECECLSLIGVTHETRLFD